MSPRFQEPKAKCNICANPVYQVSCDRCPGPLDEILCDECTYPVDILLRRSPPFRRGLRGQNNDFRNWGRRRRGRHPQNRGYLPYTNPRFPRRRFLNQPSPRLCWLCEKTQLLNRITREENWPRRSFTAVHNHNPNTTQNPAPQPDVDYNDGNQGAPNLQTPNLTPPQPSVSIKRGLPPSYRSEGWNAQFDRKWYGHKTGNPGPLKFGGQESGDGQEFRNGESSTAQTRPFRGNHRRQNPRKGPRNVNPERVHAQQAHARGKAPPPGLWTGKQYHFIKRELLDIIGDHLNEDCIPENEYEDVPEEQSADEYPQTKPQPVKLGLRGGGGDGMQKQRNRGGRGKGGRGGPPGKRGDSWDQQRPQQPPPRQGQQQPPQQGQQQQQQQQQQTPAGAAAQTTWRVEREVNCRSANLTAADLRAIVALLISVIERLPGGSGTST